jgi:hypothetical protein
MRNEFISQEELNFYTGDSKRTFSRILGKLKSENKNLVDTSQKVHKIHHSVLDDKMSKHHKVLEIFSNALIQKTNKTNEVWARYLINFDWKIFGTITFDKPKSLHSAKRFMDDIINKVRKRNKLYTCFYVCELNDYGYHVHFLMNCKLERLKPIMALIECSINKSNKSEIEEYDYKKLGSKYLTKFLDKNPESYDIYFG